MPRLSLALALGFALLAHPDTIRADSQRERRQEFGLSAGHGIGVEFAGSGLDDGHEVETLILLPHWQIELWRSARDPEDRWSPRLDLRVEGTAIVNFTPTAGYALGGGLFLRHYFAGEARLSPYLHAGAGILALEYGLRDQTDGLAFNPQAGLGLRWEWRPGIDLDLELRFQHISNAYTSSPNRGIDSLQFLIGISRRSPR